MTEYRLRRTSKKITFCETDVRHLTKKDPVVDRKKSVNQLRKRKQGICKRSRQQEDFPRENETFEEFQCGELQRKSLRRVYQYDEEEIENRKGNGNVEILYPQENENKLIKFIIYLAMEHETLVEIILILPLTLMVFYIVVIEKGSLFQFIER